MTSPGDNQIINFWDMQAKSDSKIKSIFHRENTIYFRWIDNHEFISGIINEFETLLFSQTLCVLRDALQK